MEIFEAIVSSLENNTTLLFLLGIMFTFLESFIPALPLIAIVTLNSAVLGFWGGLISSIIGSCLGTSILFLLAFKFSSCKFIKNLSDNKLKKIHSWIKRQGYTTIFICYSSLFLPSFLITIACGLSGHKLKDFLPPMITGKTVLFLAGSYLGYDLKNIILKPYKIIFIAIFFIVSYFIGKKVNASINKY